MKICYTKLRSSHSDGKKTLKLATKHASGLATAATGRLFARLTCPKSLCAINHSRNNKRINAAFWWAHHICYIYILYICLYSISISIYYMHRQIIRSFRRGSQLRKVARTGTRCPFQDVHSLQCLEVKHIYAIYIYVIKYVYNIVVACFYNHITI